MESEIRAYIPEADCRKGKKETGDVLFYEDFGVLNPATYELVVARGLYISAGKEICLTREEQDFLEWNIGSYPAVAVRWKDSVLVFLRGFYSTTGLLPVVLPHGDPGAIAFWLVNVGFPTVRCSLGVVRMSAGQSVGCELLQRLEGSMSQFKRVFNPPLREDFRFHCALIARLAGFRADVTSLPTGHYPIEEESLGRWTMFLLCTFLSLRGDSSTKLELSYADRADFHLRLVHLSEYCTKRKFSIKPFYPFAGLSVFSDYRLLPTKNGFVLEAVLHRAHTSDMLSADGADWMELLFSLEIVFS